MSGRRTAASLFSHIFKTPLASIQAASEILLRHLKGSLSEKDQQLLEVVLRNSRTLDLRVTKLVEALHQGDSVITEDSIEMFLKRGHLESIHSLQWETPVAEPVVIGELPVEVVAIPQAQPQAPSDKEGDGKIVVHADPEIADLIPRFLENRQKDIVSIMDALKSQNFETIKILGHSMKGAGGGYGFPGVTDIGKSIEEAAKVEDSDAILMALDKLTNYLDRVEVIYE